MKKDSFFNIAQDPNLSIISDISNVFMSSGNIPDSSLSNVEEFETPQVNVGTSTISHLMENAANVAEDSDSGLASLNQLSAASFDTIFSPYTTYFSHETFPKFEIPTNKTDPNSLTLNPFNPNNELSLYYAPTGSELWTHSLADTGAATAAELAKENSPSGWLQYGHGLGFATVGSGVYDDGPKDYNFQKDFFRRKKVEVEHVRSVGLRAPMVLSGWGYDVNGKPVPADTGDPNAFASGAFRNPSNWKSGPLDIRWDDQRKVWGSPPTKIYLAKATNTYNPASFSYEVDRSDSRSQFTRFAPGSMRTVNLTENIYDPESVAYSNNSNNVGSYEQLNYGSLEYPFYEAFIIRESVEEISSTSYYNIWSEDCQDCGHISNSGCGTQHGSDSTGKKILIENPLRQNLDVGDLLFTIKTGRKKKVNTGTFTGGTGSSASGEIIVNSSGTATTNITSPGTGYTLGAFALASGNICVDISVLLDGGGSVTGISLDQTNNFTSGTYPLDIIPNDATVTTEELDIHWIMQAEFKTQQVNTHVECEGGILQSCSVKIQTQGFKSCEWCGEDTTYINSF